MILSVTGMGGRFPLAPSNETNYLSRSLNLEMFLRSEDLWTVVSNPPADLNEEQQRQNVKAHANIILCLDDSQVIHVHGLKSGAECTEFMKKSKQQSNSHQKTLSSKSTV